MTISLKPNMTTNLCVFAGMFQVVQEAPRLIYKKHTAISPPKSRQ